MWKLISFLILLFTPLSVRADLVHKLSTSTSLTVGGATTIGERIGSTYAVSGNNVAVSSADGSVFGGLTAGSATAAPTMKAGTYDIGVDNSAFSFSESYTQGDAIAAMGAGVDVSADGLVVDMPAFGNTTTQSGGVKGSLAGTILSSGILTVTAGGANTLAVGQFVSEISVK